MIEFAHPALLWAAPAALLPLLIHLVSRRHHRPVPWAAMIHLRRAERRSRRRIRWHNLLLLLLRTAAVLLLVLLFARPVLRAGPAGLGRPRRNVVLLLDDSASMARKLRGRSAFDRARAFATGAAERVAAGGSGLVVCVASEEDPVFESSSLSPVDLATVRDRLDARGTRAVRLAPGSRLPRLARSAAALRRPEFYLITDLRAADWGRDQLDPGARRGLALLGEHGPVHLVDAGGGTGAGLRIEGLEGADRFLYAGRPAALRAVVSNAGEGSPRGPTRAEVVLDGRPLRPLEVPAVPEGEKRAVPFEVLMEEPGPHSLTLRLAADDPYPPDDERHFVLEASGPARVLLVDGAPGGGNGAAETYFLRRALQPTVEPDAGIRTRTASAAAGPPADLSGYAAVFLCNLPGPGAWASRLRDYARQGGRVVAFLGDRVEAEAWNSTLLGEDGLPPCRLGAVQRPAAEQAFRLGQVDFGHPLLAPFQQWRALFDRPEFGAFIGARPLEGSRVLARYDDAGSSPALLLATTGKGLAALFTTSADDEWTDWPRSETGRITYLSLVQWLVEFGRSALPEHLNAAGGAAVSVPLPGATAGVRALLESPVDSSPPPSARVTRQRDGAAPAVRTGPLKDAGIWQLRLPGRGKGREMPIAVNPPPAEGRLQRARRQLFDRHEVQVLGPRTVEAVGSGRAEGTRVWPALAVLLLAMLSVEAALAYRFGNPSGGSR